MTSSQLPVDGESASFGSLGVSTRARPDVDLLVGLLETCRGIADPGESVRMALGSQGRLADLIDGAVSSESAHLRAAVWFANEVAKRVALGRASRRKLQRPDDVAAVATRVLAEAARERLLLLVCDAGNKLIQATVVTEGTADRLWIPVRETLSVVLWQGGRGFAIAHNHPSGDVTPSPADIDGTRALAAAAKTVGLRFLGHVIVAHNAWQAVGSGEVREGRVDG